MKDFDISGRQVNSEKFCIKIHEKSVERAIYLLLLSRVNREYQLYSMWYGGRNKVFPTLGTFLLAQQQYAVMYAIRWNRIKRKIRFIKGKSPSAIALLGRRGGFFLLLKDIREKERCPNDKKTTVHRGTVACCACWFASVNKGVQKERQRSVRNADEKVEIKPALYQDTTSYFCHLFSSLQLKYFSCCELATNTG